MLKHQIRPPPAPLFSQLTMAIPTLIEFATDKRLTRLLIKERAKCRRRNRDEKNHRLDRDCDISELTNNRKKLSRLMPARHTWVRPSKRKKLVNGTHDTKKIIEKSLFLTIRRDQELQKEGETFAYLEEQQAFFAHIRDILSANEIKFESPRLFPIYKDHKKQEDGTLEVTCRPLSVYSQLTDKIILALTSRYLTRFFDRYLHENILSYRHVRVFNGQKRQVTDFNDGMKLIKAFREAHVSEDIYVSDCDIKKFYDIIPHDVVRDCFRRMLDKPCLSDDGKNQVMRVVEAYLASYNFYTNALQKSREDDTIFVKVRRKFHDKKKRNTYRIEWVDELLDGSPEQYPHIGVPQGGALSLLVANIVLNDVDRVLTSDSDPNRLFIRFCDDMILLHTDYKECCRLMDAYAKSLSDHGLYYHPFKKVSDCSRKEFWKIKSHSPFLWGEGDGNCNRYIGFLGYELRRDGIMRLRKSNIRRFKEKFTRQKFALRRYLKDHTEEEYLKQKKKALDTIMNGINFYTAFDQERFKCSGQYHYIKNLRRRLE